MIDFVADFLISNILGLIAHTHSVHADQSKEKAFNPGCIQLAQLASKAVDFPKTGIPVNPDQLPRSRRSLKPDWSAKEIDSPSDQCYQSNCAIGYLHRAITLDANGAITLRGKAHDQFRSYSFLPAQLNRISTRRRTVPVP